MYSSQADILTIISSDQLKQLTSDNGMTIDANIVNSVISGVDTKINSYCTDYVTPFNFVPDLIKEFSKKMSVRDLFQRRILTMGGVPEDIQKMYDECVSHLEKIMTGRANIPGAQKKSLGNSPVQSSGGSFSSDERIFSNESLKDF